VDDERLRTLVAQLDALVPPRGAAIRDGSGLYGSEHDEALDGNRLGYLRLGIELLKVADAPAVPGRPDRIEVDLAYLGYSGPEPAVFERREGITLPQMTWPSHEYANAFAGGGLVERLAHPASGRSCGWGPIGWVSAA
jgi:hypothetical protein